MHPHRIRFFLLILLASRPSAPKVWGERVIRLKLAWMGVELIMLKRAARQFGVPINANLSDSALMQDLWAKIADHPDAECRDVVRGLDEFRSGLVTNIIEDPTQLIR